MNVKDARFLAFQGNGHPILGAGERIFRDVPQIAFGLVLLIDEVGELGGVFAVVRIILVNGVPDLEQVLLEHGLLALMRACLRFGWAMVSNIPMIAITIMSSMRVKPLECGVRNAECEITTPDSEPRTSDFPLFSICILHFAFCIYQVLYFDPSSATASLFE